MRRMINKKLYVQAKDLDYISYMELFDFYKLPDDLKKIIFGITNRIDDYSFMPFHEQKHIDILNNILNSFSIDYDEYKNYNLGEIEVEIDKYKNEISMLNGDNNIDEAIKIKNIKHKIHDLEVLYNYKENGFSYIPGEPRKAPTKVYRLL